MIRLFVSINNLKFSYAISHYLCYLRKFGHRNKVTSSILYSYFENNAYYKLSLFESVRSNYARNIFKFFCVWRQSYQTFVNSKTHCCTIYRVYHLKVTQVIRQSQPFNVINANSLVHNPFYILMYHDTFRLNRQITCVPLLWQTLQSRGGSSDLLAN